MFLNRFQNFQFFKSLEKEGIRTSGHRFWSLVRVFRSAKKSKKKLKINFYSKKPKLRVGWLSWAVGGCWVVGLLDV